MRLSGLLGPFAVCVRRPVKGAAGQARQQAKTTNGRKHEDMDTDDPRLVPITPPHSRPLLSKPWRDADDEPFGGESASLNRLPQMPL
jgi:hypothetical protein